MPLLDVRALHVRARGTDLVDGVDLRVDRDERVAVLGPSGSGKSLTAAAVLGILPPALTVAGSVRLGEREVLGVPAARRARRDRPGSVRQDPAAALHPLVPVGRQLAAARGRTLRTVRPVLTETLRDLGFRDPARVLGALPAELSGGQRQRICLALALAGGSPLLVADEPTTALDVVTQAGVLDLLRARTGPGTGRGLLFVTHDIAVAAALCDRVVVLQDGRVVEDGPVAVTLRAPRHPLTASLLDAARDVETHLGPLLTRRVPA
ncbi:ATP-binding cassette domain-containing protein [Kineococcus gynurae]|uniref:ATP-binding cassette domain-containing protein n=1 Tax=Kineococcus gynurae TaxID=452979 RepID=A0ABV5LU51_9ACTN